MTEYSEKEVEKQVNEILNAPYEQIYSFEREKALFELCNKAKQNNDQKTVTKILWEIDLLNRSIGHHGTHEGKTVVEIYNKWNYFADATNFTEPLKNEPFCVWTSSALDYYKARLQTANTELTKARYSFAILTLSSGKERVVYAEQSFKHWINSAENYVSNKKYRECHGIVPLAYKLAIKIALSFQRNDCVKSAITSLHESIKKLVADNDRRTVLDLFDVEVESSKHLNKIDASLYNKFIEESRQLLDKIIGLLEAQKSYLALRAYLQTRIAYKSTAEDEYALRFKLANSFIQESESRKGETVVQTLFLQQAIKEFKSMESKFPDKKTPIQKEINLLINRIKEAAKTIQYKRSGAVIEITNKQIQEWWNALKQKGGNLFVTFLSDDLIIQKKDQVVTYTEEHKKQFPLAFMFPVTVYLKDTPIAQHTSEEHIFDYNVRRNILMGTKMGEIVVSAMFKKLETELNISDEVKKIISISELDDIKLTLETGLLGALGNNKNPISSLHILTPYIEELIRRILVKKGKVDSVIETEKQKIFRKIELGSLLVNSDVKACIGEDFAYMLKVWLVDNDQENLRNLLLHGLLEAEKFTDGLAMLMAYVTLRLSHILSS